MKILALSDLHLEFRCQGISQIVNHGPDLSAYKGKVDVVILAGDIGIGEQTWTYREDLEAYMRVPVLAIPGNHDFYGQALFPWKAVLGACDKRCAVYRRNIMDRFCADR
jgi:predicted phosphodiesterase